jgi:signal transduction histidine kinase
MRWIRRESVIEASVRLGELAAGVAHDLRSPIAALKVFERSQDNIDENQRALLLSAIDRIEGIAREILGIYKAGKDMSDPVLTENFAYLPIIRITEDLLKLRNLGLRSASRPAVSCEWGAILPNDVLCNVRRVQILRAIDNIVGNAIDATKGESAPEVKVAFRLTEKSRVELTVYDNGPGFSKETLERLKASDFGISSKTDGHGIGLAQVHRTVLEHQGQVVFGNNATKGAFVTLSFIASKS